MIFVGSLFLATDPGKNTDQENIGYRARRSLSAGSQASCGRHGGGTREAVQTTCTTRHAGREGVGRTSGSGLGNMLGREVGAVGATPVNDVAVGVSLGADDAGEALLGDTHEVVRARGGADGINGDLHGTRRAVLEADGAREARGELSVQLGLGGAGPDGAPRDGVGGVLRRDGIEELGAARHTHFVDAHEELRTRQERETETGSAPRSCRLPAR